MGCEDVDGFDAVALGEKVDTKRVMPGIVAKCQKTLMENPMVRCFLFECTELPPYSDAVRHATGLPVYDAITSCNMIMEGMVDNARFGLNGWHLDWDGQQADVSHADVQFLMRKSQQ